MCFNYSTNINKITDTKKLFGTYFEIICNYFASAQWTTVAHAPEGRQFGPNAIVDRRNQLVATSARVVCCLGS